MRWELKLLAAFSAAAILPLCVASTAEATLKLYYDPDTGNVAFDTAETRSGSILSYSLSIEWSPDWANITWRFRPENLIRLSQSRFFDADPTGIGEATLTTPWTGLYTIGEVLPTGLSQEVWSSMGWYGGKPLSHSYVDIFGGGEPPPAELIYGRPAGEFVNRWDLVDPNTLNWAKSATLIYRDWSGEVLVDTPGYVSYIWLKSDGKINAEAYTRFIAGPLNEATPNEIAIAADAIEPGRYSLGSILPAGLNAAGFAAAFVEAKFVGKEGFNGRNFNFVTDGIGMSFQFVPEPEGIFLGAILLVTAALTSRSRIRIVTG